MPLCHRFTPHSLICIFLLVFAPSTGFAQNDGRYPFVTVEDTTANVDANTNKVFSTTIQVLFRNRTNGRFMFQLFVIAADEFYGRRSGLNGYKGISNQKYSDDTSSLVLISYDVTYDFMLLQNSTMNDSGVIERSIGIITSVKPGLEADSNFTSLYTVSSDPSTFTFTGNSLCDEVGCPQGQFTYCEEERNNWFTSCKSSCKVGYCENNGWCMHYDGNTAPLCSCPSTNSEWYFGSHCEIYIHLWMPILAFILVILVLIAIPILACCLPLKLKKRKRIISVIPREERIVAASVYQPKPSQEIVMKETTDREPKPAMIKPRDNIADLLSNGYHETVNNSGTIPSSSSSSSENDQVRDYEMILSHQYATPDLTQHEESESGNQSSSSTSGDEYRFESSVDSREVGEEVRLPNLDEEVNRAPPTYSVVNKKQVVQEASIIV